MNKPNNNPTVEIYRGIEVKQYPLVRLRISTVEFKRLVDAKLDLGLSTRDAIENKKIICKECTPIEVISFKHR